MAEFKTVKKDDYLFKEGDAPDNMYIIRTGTLAITKSKNNAEVILTEIGPGAMVGEMALFDSKPRSANVKAVKDSEVVCLPYKGLEQQLTQLPEWIRAIMRTLNQNLRDANQKIKQLGQTETAESRFPPQLINKLLSIISLVGLKYGEKDSAGGVTVPPGILRKYTIQIFLEPTNKMTFLLSTLKDLGYFLIQDIDDNKQKIVNKNPEFIFQFIEWHNDMLFKTDSEKLVLSLDEAKALKATAVMAAQRSKNLSQKTSIYLDEIAAKSLEETQVQIKVENFNLFSAKGLCTSPILTQNGVCVDVIPDEILKLAEKFIFLENLKLKLK